MPKNLTRCHLITLASIVLIGLALRLALVGYVASYPERYIQADAIGYDRLAVNLVSGHGFSMRATTPFSPDNLRTPIYPLAIASFYILFGYHPDSVLWLQAFIGALTILLTFYLAERICGPKAGLIAAALLAISPHSITYSALLWSDTEYTLLFLLSIILTMFMLTSTRIKWVLWSGFVSGLAVLTHPRSIHLPVLVAILLAGAMFMRRTPLKKILVHVGTYIIVFNVVLLPWRFRNFSAFGVPNITSAAGINMLHYGAALTEAARTGEDQWSISERYDAEVRETGPRPLNAAEYAELAFRLGVNKILQDPLTYGRVHFVGMAKIFLPGTSQINTLITGQDSLDTAQIYSLFTTGWNLVHRAIVQPLSDYSLVVWSYIGFEAVYLCCVYLFSLRGMIRRGGSLPCLWFIIVVLCYLAAVAGPAGAPRFRVVMMPLLSILAAHGMLPASDVLRENALFGRLRAAIQERPHVSVQRGWHS